MVFLNTISKNKEKKEKNNYLLIKITKLDYNFKKLFCEFLRIFLINNVNK